MLGSPVLLPKLSILAGGSVNSLPGDNITEQEAKELAAEHNCPVSNICRYCGKPAVMMAYTMTGACCGDHEKLRHDPTRADVGHSIVPLTEAEKG